MVLVSATTDNGDAEGLEGEILNELGFKVYKNQVFKNDRGDKPMDWQLINLENNDDKLDFIQKEQQ